MLPPPPPSSSIDRSNVPPEGKKRTGPPRWLALAVVSMGLVLGLIGFSPLLKRLFDGINSVAGTSDKPWVFVSIALGALLFGLGLLMLFTGAFRRRVGGRQRQR
jgi:hypothetical protein